MSLDSDVLQHYIDELLQPVPLPAGSDGAAQPMHARQSAPEPQTPATQLLDDAERREQLQQLLYSARAAITQHTAPKPAVPVAAATAEPKEPPAQALTAPENEAQTLLDETLQWHDNGRPGWAQEPFEVLLFTVSGLTLAVPLIALGHIQPLTDELTPLFGQADWFMGLQPTPFGKVRIVNTAKFVMPERYDARFVDTAQYVVSINGVPWGLAVDDVEQPMRLAPDDVKWRGSRSKRPWLAGTVKQHMCALLDIPMMGKLLTDADRNRRR